MKHSRVFFIIALITLFVNSSYVFSQHPSKYLLEKVKETAKIVELPTKFSANRYSFNPIGFKKDHLIFHYIPYDTWNHVFFILNESDYSLKESLENLSLHGYTFSFFSYNNTLLFYTKAFFDNAEYQFGKRDLFLYSQNNDIVLLDSINNANKKVSCSFSGNEKYLIVNTFFKMADYYDPEMDNKFTIYSLDSLSRGIVQKREIPCSLCTEGRLIGDRFIFNKSLYRDDTGNFEWTNIYIAPFDNLEDTVRIATHSQILAVSPDGRYILGTRHDRPNYPVAIIDVESQRYQLMLGRNYSRHQAFYSHAKEKFAFWMEGRIVYLDFPKEYPFDALRPDNPDIPGWTETEFYRQFELPPFE